MKRKLTSKSARKGHELESGVISQDTSHRSPNFYDPIPYTCISGFQSKVACTKCLGEGQTQVRPSKKAQYQYKRDKQAALERNEEIPQRPPLRIERCPICSGTGLVDAKTENQQYACAQTVAIVGGGIGGLALALALQQRRIPCVVYERDSCFEERRQGYGLTMQQAVKALRSLGFYDNSTAEEGFGIHSKRHLVHTPDGEKVGEWGLKVWGRPQGKQEASRQNAHIPRQTLRRMLLDSLLPGTVMWGYKLVDFHEVMSSPDENAKSDSHSSVCLDLECTSEGETGHKFVHHRASVLVGADGIRSSVRMLKLSDKKSYPLRYLDCIVVLGIAPSPKSELTDGETVFQTADGTTRLYAMPFASAGKELAGAFTELQKELCEVSIPHTITSDSGETMWQLSFPIDEVDAKRLSCKGANALKEEALNRCGTWHAPIPELLNYTPASLVTGYPCYDCEVMSKRDLRVGSSPLGERSQVTLIGDAAHPMSPFKGQGANQALLDAVLLARALSAGFRFEDSDALSKSLAAFEETMLERSAVKVRASADAAKFLHSDLAVAKGNITRGAAAKAEYNL